MAIASLSEHDNALLDKVVEIAGTSIQNISAAVDKVIYADTDNTARITYLRNTLTKHAKARIKRKLNRSNSVVTPQMLNESRRVHHYSD